ncbi:isocyanide synthase family protein [Streptomyces triculaminicus]|uniref:Isocyanide synthase family protein n=2 Tax=Streptomyces TaxID=1883 RepID=A0A939JN96_9ACTN|nr:MULTISPECIES: isocyanide synthase family protein [Streptomyces]MBO0651402.1 isocyanide synthase family protein [Streptomyces triculaminicus]QSY49711.1 isocyanide synthase family protein [Streptomyces griseocarneus]
MYDVAAPAVETVAVDVLKEVLSHQRRLRDGGCAGEVCPRCVRHHLEAVRRAMASGRRIEFVLPAFPTKSPNPAKVLGPLPDLAEELALRFLDGLCERIARIYPPGAVILICSDGRVFNDLLGVGDENVTGYVRALDRMITRIGATRLEQFTLDEVHPGAGHEDMRAMLSAGHAPTLEELREEVRGGGAPLAMYRGITRFMLEDLSTPDYTGTRSALQRRCRQLAYRVIQRSRAWGNLLDELFPDAVRLSIHPQPCATDKIGILLADTPDAWLTPWHGVAVASGGRFTLMKRADAERAGATLAYVGGRPSFYALEPAGTGGSAPAAAHREPLEGAACA